MASLADQLVDDLDSLSDSDSAPANSVNSPHSPSLPTDTDTDTVETATTRALSSLLSRIALTGPPDPTLLSDCTHLLASIDVDIHSLHRQLLSAHSPAFPELQSLIPTPLDYARVAARSANIPDLSRLDLRTLLPSGTAIAVHVTYSSSARRALSPAELRRVHALCAAMERLEQGRLEVLAFVESRVGDIAPNLVALVGGGVAATLLGAAGGVHALARLPSCNVKVLGRARRKVGGEAGVVGGGVARRVHEGAVFGCPVVMGLPERLRGKGGEVVAGKAALAARVDAARKGGDGERGRRVRGEVERKFDKWQEPGVARTAKPLPVPGEEAKRRHRGGRRARKEKERMGLSEVRRMANRVRFGEAETYVGNDLESEGVGMVGVEGSGKLRVQTKKTDSVAVAAKRRLQKQRGGGVNEAQRLGIASLAFTPADGAVEMQVAAATPAAGEGGLEKTGEERGKQSKSTYFSASTPFLGVNKRDRDIAKPKPASTSASKL